jgi:hypothetical protein
MSVSSAKKLTMQLQNVAILRILNKRGELLEVPVLESVQQVDQAIEARERNRRNFVKLTDKKDGKYRLVQIRYVYDIVDDGSYNQNYEDSGIYQYDH